MIILGRGKELHNSRSYSKGPDGYGKKYPSYDKSGFEKTPWDSYSSSKSPWDTFNTKKSPWDPLGDSSKWDSFGKNKKNPWDSFGKKKICGVLSEQTRKTRGILETTRTIHWTLFQTRKIPGTLERRRKTFGTCLTRRRILGIKRTHGMISVKATVATENSPTTAMVYLKSTNRKRPMTKNKVGIF